MRLGRGGEQEEEKREDRLFHNPRRRDTNIFISGELFSKRIFSLGWDLGVGEF